LLTTKEKRKKRGPLKFDMASKVGSTKKTNSKNTKDKRGNRIRGDWMPTGKGLGDPRCQCGTLTLGKRHGNKKKKNLRRDNWGKKSSGAARKEKRRTSETAKSDRRVRKKSVLGWESLWGRKLW